MAQALSSAVWPPTPVSSEVKELLARLFHLVDQKDDNVGTILAEQIFTADASFISANGTFKGKDGIDIPPSLLPCNLHQGKTDESQKYPPAAPMHGR